MVGSRKGRTRSGCFRWLGRATGLLTLLARGERGAAYNVADGSAHGTIREVAQLAVDALGDGRSKVVVDFDESNSAGYAPDVHLRLSSAKLRGLGWEPTVGLEGSFRELAEVFVEQTEF